jgi:Tfp pilus assembly protein PilE
MTNGHKRPLRPFGGFTLVEMCVSMAILTLLGLAMWNVFWQVCQVYNKTSLMSLSSEQASFALDRMVIGMGTNYGLREAQASTVTATSTTTNWQLSYTNGLSFTYWASRASIVDQSNNTVVANLLTSTMTYLTNGVQISVSVTQACGGVTVTNTMATFVQFRN